MSLAEKYRNLVVKAMGTENKGTFYENEYLELQFLFKTYGGNSVQTREKTGQVRKILKRALRVFYNSINNEDREILLKMLRMLHPDQYSMEVIDKVIEKSWEIISKHN